MSPGLCCFLQPQFPTKPTLSWALDSASLTVACRGHTMASRQERTEKEDQGWCLQPPHVHKSRRAQQFRTGGAAPPLKPRHAGVLRGARGPGEKASRINLLPGLVQKTFPIIHLLRAGGVLSPRWLQQELSLSMPPGSNTPQGFRGVLTTLSLWPGSWAPLSFLVPSAPGPGPSCLGKWGWSGDLKWGPTSIRQK